MNKADNQAFKAGIDSYLLGLYVTPIHALANHIEKYGKSDRFDFALGFNFAKATFE